MTTRLAYIRRLATVGVLTNLVLTREDIVFIISVLTVCLSALIEILKLFKDKPQIEGRTS